MGTVTPFPVPRTAANVLRSIGARHPEQADEMTRLAVKMEDALRGPMDSNKLRDLNAAWARGVYWCEKFKGDVDPLRMP